MSRIIIPSNPDSAYQGVIVYFLKNREHVIVLPTLNHCGLHNEMYYCPLTWFITSSAKLSSRFSIPSPTAKRTNEVMLPPVVFTKSRTF